MKISTQFLVKILLTFNSDFSEHLKTKKLLCVYMWVLFPQGSVIVINIYDLCRPEWNT